LPIFVELLHELATVLNLGQLVPHSALPSEFDDE
jgi:hypothetical protein